MKEYMSKAVTYFSGKLDTYKSKFSESDLMKKITSVSKKAGVTTVYYALLLYYALMSDSIPMSKRVMVIAALGYFISPLDFIPDFILGGLLDDTSVLMFAIHSILPYVTEDVKARAKAKLYDWFGEKEVSKVDLDQLQLFQNTESKNDDVAQKINDSEAEPGEKEESESDAIENDYWDNFNDALSIAEDFLEKKEYEHALPILLSAYEIFTLPEDYYALVEALGKEEYDRIIVWLCYNIGFCYAEQKDYVRAFYYLDQVRLSGDIKCLIEWINVIVNSAHPSAIETVENIMNHQEDLTELWDGEDLKTVMDFLERRLGYLYIEYGRRQEARDIFTHLLNNPNSKAFAQKELDYLDQIESKG